MGMLVIFKDWEFIRIKINRIELSTGLERITSLLVLRNVLLNVLFLTLLAQKILSVITYSREELLDIRATSAYQHYDQEYDCPETDPLFTSPPRAFDLIPEADPKQRRRRRGRRSGLLVRHQRCAHHPPLPSILLANVKSLDNKVDKIRARVAFQRDIRHCNILCFTETWLSRDMLSESAQPPGFFMRRA
jgi:hypothetical protein